MAVTKPSVRTIKEFQFRGATKQVSNRFYFNGGTPADSDAWHSFFDAVVLKEKAALTGSMTIVAAHAYLPGSEVAVASKAYTTVGLVTAGVSCPGECAYMLRQATSKLSKKNHPVYVFSYFHNARRGDNPDEVEGTLKTALETYGGFWQTGITGGGVTAVRSTPDGVAVTGTHVDPFITHRDFPN
jgi:hypothetical protein